LPDGAAHRGGGAFVPIAAHRRAAAAHASEPLRVRRDAMEPEAFTAAFTLR